ncbi:MAG: TonB family protein [Terriglobales bacterium]
MTEIVKWWEGRIIDGKYPLQNYLGGSDHGAVFLTQRDGASGKAVIKLIPSDADVVKRLQRWQAARELNHPNLIRLFESGLEGTELLYVVEEYAEENLSQVIPERALTADEARGMLPPILQALQYLHDQGFVHGHIHPSNILASGEQVKLASDVLSVPGVRTSNADVDNAYGPPEATRTISAAVDVWQLGIMLIEVLTQRAPVLDLRQKKAPVVPDGIPQPFREIIENCLQVDPTRRWSLSQIGDCLRRPQPELASAPAVAAAREVAISKTPGAPVGDAAAAEASAISGTARGGRQSAKWTYTIGLVAAVVVASFLVARPKSPPNPASQSGEHVVDSSAGAGYSTKPEAPALAANDGQRASGSGVSGAASAPSGASAEGKVNERVIPQITPAALRTIKGRIRIRVKVDVDEAGNVTQARLKSSGSSRHFAQSALEAARGWKFDPPRQNGQPVPSQWLLQFALSRRAIDDSVEQIKP